MSGGAVEDLKVVIEGDGDQLTSELDTLENRLGTFRAAVGTAGAAVAGLSAVLAGQAVNSAREFESAMVEVQKVTSEATAEKLSDSLLRIGEETPVATQELANVAEVAGRLGVEGTDNIEAFTETVSRMGVATDINAQEAANNFARLSNALGVPIEEAENMGSSINALSNNVAASSSEIVESMTRAAPAAGQLGVEFDELAALQSTLVASGMRVERAGTRMNRSLTLLSQETEAVAQATGMTTEEFRGLIENNPTEALFRYLEHLNSIESRTRRVSEATDIFGSSGSKAVLTLAQNYDSLRSNVESSNDAYAEATSLNEEFEAQAQTLDSAIQRLRNTIFRTSVTTGQEFLPAVTDGVDGLSDAVAAFNDMNEASDGAAGSLALTAGMFGGLGTAAFAFVGGPAAALVGAAGAIALAYQTNFGEVADSVDAGLDRADRRIDRFIAENQGAATQIEGAWSTLGPAIEGGVGFAVDGLLGIVTAAIDLTTTAFTVAGRLLKGEFQAPVTELTGFTIRQFRGLLGFLDRWGGDAGSAIANGIVDGVNDAADVVEDFVNGLPEGVRNQITGGGEFDMGAEFSLPDRTSTQISDSTGEPGAATEAGLAGAPSNAAENQQAAAESQQTAAEDLKAAAEEQRAAYQSMLDDMEAGGSRSPTATGTAGAGGGIMVQATPALAEAKWGTGMEAAARMGREKIRVTPDLIDKVAQQQDSATPANTNLTEEQFQYMTDVLMGRNGTSRPEGMQSSSPRAPRGGFGRNAAMAFAENIRQFGSHVDTFKQAVKMFANAEFFVEETDQFEVTARNIAQSEFARERDRYRRGVGGGR